MMRQWWIVVIIFLFIAPSYAAVVNDNDGILGAVWDAPVSGNIPTAYVLSYTINGVQDSVQVEVSALRDSSVVLTNVGDWSVLNILSVYDYWSEILQQTVRVQSTEIVSDTVTYSTDVSVNPPTGVRWE